jgi:FkbM family methyltransferase
MVTLSLCNVVELNCFRQCLNGPLNILLLGSRGDSFNTVRQMQDAVRIFGVDALAPEGETDFVPIRSVISDTVGEAVFIERNLPHVSSLLEADWEAVTSYGMEAWYHEIARHKVQTTTIAEVARQHNVDCFHFIKTDLEGSDLAAIRGLGDKITDTLLVCMEVRFERMCVGEPLFPEIAQYLDRYGFRVLDLDATDRWRHTHTAHWDWPTRGRLNYVNVVFINEDPGCRRGAKCLALAYLLTMQGYANHAEYLLENGVMTSAEEHGALAELVTLFFPPQVEKKPYLPRPNFPHSVP